MDYENDALREAREVILDLAEYLTKVGNTVETGSNPMLEQLASKLRALVQDEPNHHHAQTHHLPPAEVLH